MLSDICSYSRDRVAVSELNTSTYFSTENMLPGKAGSTEATSLPTILQTTACHKGDTLVSNIRPYFKKIIYCEDECGCSTDVLCFTPVHQKYAAYLFSLYLLINSSPSWLQDQRGLKCPVVISNRSCLTLSRFHLMMSWMSLTLWPCQFSHNLHSNKAENKRLSAIRDALLPKLMSGEIDVSAVQL